MEAIARGAMCCGPSSRILPGKNGFSPLQVTFLLVIPLVVRMARAFKVWLSLRNEFLDFVFPSRCPVCGKPLSHGPPRPCPECLEGLFGPRPPCCVNCSRPLGPGRSRGEKCPACRKNPFFRGKLAAPFYYHGNGGKLVRALKFEKDTGAGIFLGKAITMAGRAAGILRYKGSAILVPVPLHPRKKRERGLDQALFLAEEISRRTGHPVLQALKRTRYTLAQGDPLNASRELNIKDAFAVRRFARARIRGKETILVDDVVTSGATARECRKVLREAGAKKVHLLASCLGG